LSHKETNIKHHYVWQLHELEKIRDFEVGYIFFVVVEIVES